MLRVGLKMRAKNMEEGPTTCVNRNYNYNPPCDVRRDKWELCTALFLAFISRAYPRFLSPVSRKCVAPEEHVHAIHSPLSTNRIRTFCVNKRYYYYLFLYIFYCERSELSGMFNGMDFLYICSFRPYVVP